MSFGEGGFGSGFPSRVVSTTRTLRRVTSARARNGRDLSGSPSCGAALPMTAFAKQAAARPTEKLLLMPEK